MSYARLHRTLLLVLALPCVTTGALADTPTTPPPPGQSASATAAQGGPIVRSHGHDVRTPDANASATASAGSTANGNSNGSGK